MSLSRTRFQHHGFTLIELLIVISVIAILATIVIPRLMSAGRKAREATLRANTRILRTAVEQFQSDCGMYPADLNQLVADVGATPSMAGGGTAPAGLYQGPYFPKRGGIGNIGIPTNPFVPQSDSTIGSHWDYNATTGNVASHVTGTTLDGVAYTAL